ncbi:MAG: xanthine dehydrogenase family protein subunit M [Pseudohongiellaceae bacterium]
MTRYLTPDTVEQASEQLAGLDDARILAGGTDLLTRLNSGAAAPAVIIDIKRIAEVTTIREENGGWIIGAAVSGAALGEHAELNKAWPGVVEAANLIGSTQIQSRATLGGNLCNASPAADAVPALIAAGARCLIAGPDGRRDVAVEEIVTGPGQTSLGRGEFVTGFRLPARAPRSSDAYLRMIPRTEMDIAVAGAGVSLTLDGDDNISEVRVALGAVASTQLLAEEAAGLLKGRQPDDSILPDYQRAVQSICRPISDRRGAAAYRSHVAGILAARAAVIAWNRARQT